MPKTPRLDAIEAHLAEHDEAIVKLEETVADLVPEPPVDPRDVLDPDGVTPRERWVALCNEVAARDGITPDEANARLLLLPEFAPKTNAETAET